jgi:hypothetical protein
LAQIHRQAGTVSIHGKQRGTALLFTLFFWVFCCAGVSVSLPGRAFAGTEPTQETAGSKKIEGSWVRPDGGYILQLKDIKEDGSVTAGYFNPRSINVAKAETGQKDGALTLFVELRDTNYPGSTYTLTYDPATDSLKGFYFQAAMKQTFTVEFVRVK